MKKLLLVLSVVAMASLLFTGCLPTTNTAPVITTTALSNATVDVAYTYTVEATDADVDDVLVFSLVSGPTDMVISEAGVISGWTPTATGTQDVTVAVTDGTDSVSADFTITIEDAPIEPVAPTITAIPDQEVAWDEDGWTYQVVATLGTGTTLTYSLIGEPISMSISTTGLITWTTILDVLALEEVTVKVVDNDALSAEEIFDIEVTEPIPPVVIPLTVDSIVYESDHSYNDGTTQFVRGGSGSDCVGVTVTLSEAVTATDKIEIRWDDGEITQAADANWVTLTADTANEVFTGDLCFDGAEILACEQVCVEVQLVTPDLFCPACDGITTLIHTEMVEVDSAAPYVDLNITFDSCTTSTCPTVTAAIFSFETDLTGDYCNIYNCCVEECSGLASWIIENTDLCNPCFVSGETCPVQGDFPCGCMVYADSGETITYDLDFTMVNNVGNTFEDTWSIEVDTDSVVEFKSDGNVIGPDDGVYSLYDFCDPVPELQ